MTVRSVILHLLQNVGNLDHECMVRVLARDREGEVTDARMVPVDWVSATGSMIVHQDKLDAAPREA